MADLMMTPTFMRRPSASITTLGFVGSDDSLVDDARDAFGGDGIGDGIGIGDAGALAPPNGDAALLAPAPLPGVPVRDDAGVGGTTTTAMPVVRSLFVDNSR